MQPAHPSTYANYLPLLLIVAVLAFRVYRMTKPQRMRVAQLWIAPIILILLTALSIWGTSAASAALGSAPMAPWQIALAVGAGALAGIPLGVFRGRHTEVTPTEKAGTMYVRSSPLLVAVWMGVFVLRFALRSLMPRASAEAFLIGDALLAFAVAAFFVWAVTIYTRYKELTAAPQPSAV